MMSEDTGSLDDQLVSDLLFPYIKLINEQYQEIKQLRNEVKCLKGQKDDMSTRRSLEKKITELDVQPISPVCSTSSSKTFNISSAEVPVHQGSKIKSHLLPRKRFNLNSIKSKQLNPQITKTNLAQPVGIERSLEVITSNNISDKYIRSYDPKENYIPRAKPDKPKIYMHPVSLKRTSENFTNDDVYFKGIENYTLEGEENKKKKVENLKQKQKLDETSNHLPEITTYELEVLPFSPVASTSSSGIVDLNLAEVPEKQKSQRRLVSRERFNPDSLKSDQFEPQITRKTRSQTVFLKRTSSEVITSDTESDNSQGSDCMNDPVEKHIPSAEPESVSDVIMSDTASNKSQGSSDPFKNHIPSAEPESILDVILSDTKSDKSQGSYDPVEKHIPSAEPESLTDVIMSDIASNKSQGSYDPIEKHIPSAESVCTDRIVEEIPNKILEGDLKNLEVPHFSLQKLLPSLKIEGTENMFSDMYFNKHSKMENKEIQQKRWEGQRSRELSRIEHLKRGRRRSQQNFHKNNKKKLSTPLQYTTNTLFLKIIDNLPVSVFGYKVHMESKPESFKFYHSKWYIDKPPVCNKGSMR